MRLNDESLSAVVSSAAVKTHSRCFGMVEESFRGRNDPWQDFHESC